MSSVFRHTIAFIMASAAFGVAAFSLCGHFVHELWMANWGFSVPMAAPSATSSACSPRRRCASRSLAVEAIMSEIESIANAWKSAWHNRAMSQWRFARRMVVFVDDNPEATWVQIGKWCADAVERDRPYDRCWARNIYNAGKQFEDEPETVADRRRFNMLFRGGKVEHDTQADAQRKIIASPQRNQSMAASFAKRAVDAGADSFEVVKAVAEAVGVEIGELHRSRGQKGRVAA